MKLHSQAAHDWRNDTAKSSIYFMKFAARHGVSLLEKGSASFYPDWDDVAMLLFDIHGDD